MTLRPKCVKNNNDKGVVATGGKIRRNFSQQPAVETRLAMVIINETYLQGICG